VPKHMRRLAEAFLGRCVAYDAALEAGTQALGAALARNVYASPSHPASLARYVAAADAALARAPIAAFVRGPLRFPAPEAFEHALDAAVDEIQESSRAEAPR